MNFQEFNEFYIVHQIYRIKIGLLFIIFGCFPDSSIVHHILFFNTVTYLWTYFSFITSLIHNIKRSIQRMMYLTKVNSVSFLLVYPRLKSLNILCCHFICHRKYWLLVNFDKRFSLNTFSKDSLCWHLQLNLISFSSHCLLRLEGTFGFLFWLVFSPQK